MKKILIICGPTASGKTALALDLAEMFNGEIISSDSRQVYKGLDIGTGKDIPKGFEYRVSGLKSKSLEIGYYTDYKTKIWGIDVVNPTSEFSISHFVKLAKIVISDISRRYELPIIVGGSGLYLKAITSNLDTLDMPKNDKLRKFLETKNSSELYEILAQNDPLKAASLNSSDKSNKRRLVRAIEVAVWQNENKKSKSNSKIYADYFFVGLKTIKDISKELIRKRVVKRLNEGFQEEVERLLMSSVSWEDQSMQSLGYRQIKDYFYGKITKEEFVDTWVNAEFRYLKRQLTWFKKDKRITWFDISIPNWKKDVVNAVSKWHT